MAERHKAEMARLKAAAEAQRKEAARQRRLERLNAAKTAYVDRCKVEIEAQWLVCPDAGAAVCFVCLLVA